MKSGIDFVALPVQLILATVLVVVLTATATGLPAVWLINNQLERQTWSQIDQGGRAATALYEARENELVSFAMLTSQRPTLRDLISAEDQVALEAYLETLMVGADLDMLAVCGRSGELVVLTGDISSQSVCGLKGEAGYHVFQGGTRTQVWMVAKWPMDSAVGGGGEVFAGQWMDDNLATQMRDQTGLEHSLLVSGLAAASSLGDGRSTSGLQEARIEAVEGRQGLVHTDFSLDGHPYYALRMPLGQEENLEVELALPVAANVSTRRRLIAIFAGSTLAAATLGSLVGVFLARRISQPLVSLANTAKKMRTGDLTTPIEVSARVREVVHLAEALDRARSDLLDTLTQLREEKDWGDHLLAAIVEGIVTLDDQGRVTFFSRGAERITGCEMERALGQHCDDIFSLAERKGGFSDHIPPPGAQSKLLVSLPSGREATLSFTGARLVPTESGQAQTALVFRDVSESELVHRLLGDFIANITHEFRTPLSALAASIELLEDQAGELDPDEVDELLKSLHLGIVNLQTLVDNLLESANIESGHFQVHPRAYDMGAIIAESVSTMHPLLDKYEQKLVLDLPASFPTVMADPRRTVQVFVNLLSNAIKHGPPGAEIGICAREMGEWVRVEVKDRGPGIPQDDQQDLFRRFGPLSSADKSLAVGMGLGLSVVKAIVEAQAGQVGMENRPGGGAIFWFTLPLAKEL